MKVLEDIKKYCLSRYNLSVLGAQVGIYALLVSIWSLVIMLLEHDVKAAKESMCVNAFVLFLLLIVFMANFYVLVPYLFEAKNKIKQLGILGNQSAVYRSFGITIFSAFIMPIYRTHLYE